MRQADIASKAAFTEWRTSSESPATDNELKLRGFAELSSMARLLSLRIDFVDFPPDHAEAFAGDLFERRAIDDLDLRPACTPLITAQPLPWHARRSDACAQGVHNALRQPALADVPLTPARLLLGIAQRHPWPSGYLVTP